MEATAYSKGALFPNRILTFCFILAGVLRRILQVAAVKRSSGSSESDTKLHLRLGMTTTNRQSQTFSYSSVFPRHYPLQSVTAPATLLTAGRAASVCENVAGPTNDSASKTARRLVSASTRVLPLRGCLSPFGFFRKIYPPVYTDPGVVFSLPFAFFPSDPFPPFRLRLAASPSKASERTRIPSLPRRRI